ncbi:MAG: DUF1893 domain-containing protein [Muribaculaceae bacterium]|nr:DUF1893 domain-containing protein [Muribaculaceae bacterium]
MDKERFEELVVELRKEKSNCIIVKGEELFRFSLPGVKTLMTLLKEDPSLLKDSIVFDKIVGKGAAALMILGGVAEIYAELISEHAIKLLDTTDIKFSYGERVPFIENRFKTGLCPIEMLSLTSDEPKIIHEKIIGFLSSMGVHKSNKGI